MISRFYDSGQVPHSTCSLKPKPEQNDSNNLMSMQYTDAPANLVPQSNAKLQTYITSHYN